MLNYERYKAWCEEHGRTPRQIQNVKTTEEQIEDKLAGTKGYFLKKIKDKEELTEEEEELKKLYEELDEQYKEKSVQMLNYERYKAWCEEHGRTPKRKFKLNATKKGEETEEQIENKLARNRTSFFGKIKDKGELTEEEEEIKRLYEELDELYGKKQPARNIAPIVRNVSIGESQQANEFIEGITTEKTKEGVSHNDE